MLSLDWLGDGAKINCTSFKTSLLCVRTLPQWLC